MTDAPTAETPAPAHAFPPCMRPELYHSFAARWAAKQADYDRFAESWATANGRLHDHFSKQFGELDWHLPVELWTDWQAAWARDVFSQPLPTALGLSADRARIGVAEVEAFVRAVRFVRSRPGIAAALRFWAYRLRRNPRLVPFPDVRMVRQHHPALDPLDPRHPGRADRSRNGQYSQQQFLTRAAFLLNTPRPADWGFLRRLAFGTDPAQPIWAGQTLPVELWATNLRGSVPVLALALDVPYDPRLDDPDAAISEVLGLAQNWCLSVRPVAPPTPPAHDRNHTPEAPAPTPPIPDDAGRSEPASPPADDRTAAPGPPRPKRSTTRGEARAKLIAALTNHHRYACAEELSTEPVGTSELARRAGTAKSSASDFLKSKFGGYGSYRVICRDREGLRASLKVLNGEMTPKDLSRPYPLFDGRHGEE